MLPKEQTLSRILSNRIIAVLRLDSDDDAQAICDALIAGGIRVIEVTLTTPGALRIIESLSGRPELIVGAGTVLDAVTARITFECGAVFYASPILDRATIEAAHDHGAVAIPGAATPTEIHAAHDAGADLVKLFPMPADGVRTLKTLRGPFPDIRFAPSGGVTDTTAAELLNAGAAALNVGTWLTHESDGRRSSVEVIEQRARKMVEAVRGMSYVVPRS
jgi:2-dehydro-3-deoxyphosphogluconate aldolase / (4S)-4-hydroxy-2-oxoglutarate aldolase